ncbi:MAG TPA: hypothetical protein VGP84_21675 [Gemmatimonadaceae bacterium]|jgi:hypothetical protein|nr:hypothetical protein [Gemmatimonadaceae bacterium]
MTEVSTTGLLSLPIPAVAAQKRHISQWFDSGAQVLSCYTGRVRAPGPEHELKEQLARELRAILGGDSRDNPPGYVYAHPSELSRLRHGDLRRFSLARIVRYIARAGYDIEVHLKKTPRLEVRPKPRRPVSTVVRYDYYGRRVDANY